MGYVRIPIETNPVTLAQQVFAYIQANAPGWVPSDGNLDVWIIKAMAAKAAEVNTLASDVPDTIFTYFGSTLMGVPPIDAVPASGNTTWTLSDSSGHTIPAGTYIGIRDSSGDLVTFQTVADVIVAPGDSVTAAGEVTIQAVTPGVSGNALNTTPELIDIIDWVSSIALVSPTGGGVDAETSDDYLNRLVKRLQLLSQVPIRPIDFANAATQADPGVYRALALDGYNPADDSTDNERMVTIAAVDSTGDPVSSLIKSNIENYISARREVNFIVNTMDANYTEIDVAATVVVLSGYDSTTVHADVVTAITSYLSPNNWGIDPTATGSDVSTTWTEQDTLYYNELIALVSNVAGVNRVSDLTCNIAGDPAARTDITLDSPASLTTVGTISCS